MGWKVILSPSATADLESIVSYIASDNPDAALRLGEKLIEKAEALTTFPESGRVVLELRQADLREVIHQNYRVIYRLNRQNQMIEIVRFWHGARGFPSVQFLYAKKRPDTLRPLVDSLT